MNIKQIIGLIGLFFLGANSTQAQVALIPVPPNDNFADRTVVYGTNFTRTGDNVRATVEEGEVGTTVTTASHTIWWSWTAPISGSVTINTNGSNFDTTLGVFTGNAVNDLSILIDRTGNLFRTIADDDSGDGLASLVTFTAEAGTTYQICIDGFVENVGFVQINLAMKLDPPANDVFATPQVIAGKGGTFTGTNIGATRELGEPNHAGILGGGSIWYSWTAPNTGRVKISTVRSNFATTLGVYVGGAVSQLFSATDNLGVVNSTTDSLDFKVVGGETYMIAVDGVEGRVGETVLELSQGSTVSLSGNIFFGTRTVGSVTTRSLRIRNTGTTSLKLRGIELPRGFTGRIRGTIQPGRSLSFRIIFNPQTRGTFAGNLRVKSNASSGIDTIRVRGISQ